MFYPKIIGRILNNNLKNMFVCIYKIIQLIIMKMEMKKKNRSNRYDINRPRSTHEHKFKVSHYDVAYMC